GYFAAALEAWVEVLLAASAVDVINPAFRKMGKQLFSPFRFGQWWRWAFVGFLAGEISSGGGFSLRLPAGPWPSPPPRIPPVLEPISTPVVVGLALLLLLAFTLGVVFLYISSRTRFVLFDGIVNGECRIRDSWRKRGGPAYRYFVWQFALML